MSDYRAEAFDNLVKCCGHWQNGSDTKVTITQDDATFEYVVKVGVRTYTHCNLSVALSNAAKEVRE